jgi:hypothetical protein
MVLGDLLYGQRAAPDQKAVPDEKSRAMRSRWASKLTRLTALVLVGVILYQLTCAVREVSAAWIDNLLIAGTLGSIGLGLWFVKGTSPGREGRLALLAAVAILPPSVLASTVLSHSWHQGVIAHYVKMHLCHSESCNHS